MQAEISMGLIKLMKSTDIDQKCYLQVAESLS